MSIKKSTIQFLVLCSLVVILTSCGTSQRSSKDSGSGEGQTQGEVLEAAKKRNTPEAREYAGIDADYRKRDFDKVLKRSTTYLKNFPHSEYRDQVYNLRGLAFIGDKKLVQAISQFKKAIEETENENLKNMARYNIGYCHFELNQLMEADSVLLEVRPSVLEVADRSKLYILRAKTSRMKKNYDQAAEDILGAIQTSGSEGVGRLGAMINFLDEVLVEVKSVTVLESLLSQNTDSPAADLLHYKLSQAKMASGDRSGATAHLEKIVSSYPESRHFVAAKEFLRRHQMQGAVDAQKIGVIVTLSGKFGKFGYKALQGIELATKIFNTNNDPSALNLVIMDDQGDPERAVAAMEELYFKHNVVAIIGPLVSKLAEPMGQKALELGIPMIALTQKEAKGGDYVFNASLTPEMQVRELARYAIEKAGIRNFAIMAPNSKFGEEYARAFWDELDRNGAVVKGFETYQSEDTDFRQYVDRMVGLGNPDARAKEVQELQALKAATPIKGKGKKFDRMFELKPIIDFQAVFIPDEPKVLGQILPTFAYRDVDNVVFLGINTWNNPELIARAGQFANGAVFVDGFYNADHSDAAKAFIEEYNLVFGIEPSTVEAMAYDAAKILVNVTRGEPVRSRDELRDRILHLHDFPGTGGKISYQSGRLVKRLNLLTVKSGKIEPLVTN